MKPNRLTVSIEDLQIAIAWLKCNMQDGEREGCLRVVRTLEKNLNRRHRVKLAYVPRAVINNF
jgi:hypothetical protein